MHSFGERMLDLSLHCAAVQPGSLSRNELAKHWSVPWGPDARGRGCSRPAQSLLHGASERRSVEIGRLRPQLEPDLRRKTLAYHWRDIGRAIYPEHEYSGYGV